MAEFGRDLLEWFRRVMNTELFKLGDTPLLVSTFVSLALLLITVFLLEWVLRRHVFLRLLRGTGLRSSMQYAIARILGVVFICLGVFASLQAVGLNLSSLTVFAGAVGVGIGFGLQKIISNFMCGLIILAERPVALGDFVEVAGVGGRVKAVNLRSTTVVTNDNIAMIVPNEEFVTSVVTNYSHGDPKVRVRLPIGIAYGSDVEKFKAGMLEVAIAHPDVMKNPPPDVYFIGFGESSLDFNLVVWTEDESFRPIRLRSELFYAIEAKLREIKVEIPFPQRDLHVRTSTHPMPVRMESDAPVKPA